MDKRTAEKLRKISESMPKEWIKNNEIKKMDAYLDAKVKSAIKKGEIPPAKRDDFVKKMEKKMG